jgi:YgiT-type zinc finger domain-containing protein
MKIYVVGKTCPLCGGNKKPGKADFTVDAGEGVVVVQNVSAEICDLCGEEWVAADTAKRLEAHVESTRQKHLQ